METQRSPWNVNRSSEKLMECYGMSQGQVTGSCNGVLREKLRQKRINWLKKHRTPVRDTGEVDKERGNYILGDVGRITINGLSKQYIKGSKPELVKKNFLFSQIPPSTLSQNLTVLGEPL